jgi:hypothetical protein
MVTTGMQLAVGRRRFLLHRYIYFNRRDQNLLIKGFRTNLETARSGSCAFSVTSSFVPRHQHQRNALQLWLKLNLWERLPNHSFAAVQKKAP